VRHEHRRHHDVLAGGDAVQIDERYLIGVCRSQRSVVGLVDRARAVVVEDRPGVRQSARASARFRVCLDAIAALRVARRLSALPLIAQSGNGTLRPFTGA
jgi:hypothetical protein